MLTFSMCLPYMISQYTAITSYTLLKRNCNVVDFPLCPNRIHSPLVRVVGNVLLVQFIIMPSSRQIAVNKRHHQTLKSPEKREISVLFQPWSKARSAKSASVIDNVVYPIGMEMLLYTESSDSADFISDLLSKLFTDRIPGLAKILSSFKNSVS